MLTGLASFHGGHSDFGDGAGDVADIVASAAALGFVAIGITEHFDEPPMNKWRPKGTASSYGPREPGWLPAYVERVRGAAERHGQLQVLLGTEVEYVRGAAEWTREQLARWPFDYKVGSVHFMRYGDDDICIDCDQARTDEALRRAGSPEQLTLDYFDHVLELLQWRIASVIGHMDLVKMLLGSLPDSPPVRTKVRGVLETMRDRGVAVDVNARGLIKPCRAIYPAGWILAEARGIGVPVTLGDDSHGPDQVGDRLDLAVEALRGAGYDKMWLVRPGGSLEAVALPG